MTLKTARVSMELPEILFRRIDPEDQNQWRAAWTALFEWSNTSQQNLELEREGAALEWLRVAVFLAIRTLPCFEKLRRKRTGGRPKLDVPSLSNPHAELIAAVETEVRKQRIQGKSRPSISSACAVLAQSSKASLPKRYLNIGPARLRKLYYEGKKHPARMGLMALAELAGLKMAASSN